MSNLIDGKALAQQFRDETRQRVERLKREKGITPGLGVILAGDDPASKVYVGMKTKACAEVGMHSDKQIVGSDITTKDAIALVEAYNRDDAIDGILVQLPLPKGVDEQAVLAAVSPEKDADGFHPYSLGRLMREEVVNAPCTPKGVLKALQTLDVPLEGAKAVVVGRSIIVGKPMAMLLLHQNATVTVCHSRTKDLAAVTREADILIAAVGRPFLITADHVKEGAVVVDVGTNRVPGEDLSESAIAANPAHAKSISKRGYALVGDVAFHDVQEKAQLITPVPGGVGPLTVAMLLENTSLLAELRRS